MDANSSGEDDFGAWVAYCKAKKNSEGSRVDDGGAKKVRDKVKVGGRILNGISKKHGPEGQMTLA